MQLGLLFRKEVVVAFRRIQDIHVSRNLIQRWLGIASVSIQNE
ncbi:MAG: PH domain-containing protein [Pirellula sp.]|nr:PH domain-containing protein [Pirellula sp.]